jgi:hypothetical protein
LGAAQQDTDRVQRLLGEPIDELVKVCLGHGSTVQSQQGGAVSVALAGGR